MKDLEFNELKELIRKLPMNDSDKKISNAIAKKRDKRQANKQSIVDKMSKEPKGKKK